MPAAIPYALSVHAFVTKIGDYLAFVAIIGIALLVIMFFVQARETSLLRERAEDAEEDLERLREYAEQIARQTTQTAAQATQTAAQVAQVASAPRPVAAPAVARSGSRVAPRAPGIVTLPSAPVGVGAPALASATRLIPLPEPPAAPAPAVATVPAPAPSTPAAGVTAANGRGATAPVAPVPAPSVAAAATSAGPATPAPSARTAAATPPSAAPRSPRRDYGRSDEADSRVGRGSIALAAVLVAVIIVAAVLVITHHSSSAKPSRAASATTTSKSASGTTHDAGASKTVVVNPTRVRVAVLNGTGVNNLAADVSAKLNKVGFQQGDTANYADQTQSSTTVAYLPGNRPQAAAVAKALSLGSATVSQIDPTAQQLVCPSGPSQCADQVVVVVGSNLESDAS